MKNQLWLAVAAMAVVTGGAVLAAPSVSHGAAVTVQAGMAGGTSASGGPGVTGREGASPDAGRAAGNVEFYAPGEEVAAGVSQAASQAADGAGNISPAAKTFPATSFDVNRFVLPGEARVLVAVEGTGGSSCRVSVYERLDSGWVQRLGTQGVLGANGMSNHRTEGDKTTPIGVFRMNTPFGQLDPLEGFPSSYIKVKESHVWSQTTNKLVDDASAEGEHVGTAGYAGFYDYVIDAGFNPLGLEKQGSALFFHCIGANESFTSGCVAIPAEYMIAMLKLYGTYGDGACYAAQAPEGTFDQIYQSYGVNQGLSPEGNF